MPQFFVHAINSEFRSRDEGAEYATAEEALSIGVRSATALAADEIYNGKTSAVIELRIEQDDGTPMLRSIVSILVASLLPVVEEEASSPAPFLPIG